MTMPTLPPEEAARANIYGFLARMYAGPPDAQLLEAISGADEVEGENHILVEPWIELAYAAADTDAQALGEEYARAYCRSAADRAALQCIAALCGTLRDRIARQDLDIAGQARFFDQHVVPAAARAHKLSRNAGTGRFYRRVGRFAAAFFRVERIAFQIPQTASTSAGQEERHGST